MPRLKKRSDGRYRRRKTINGVVVDFYGRTPAEVDKKIAEYERRVNSPYTFREIAEKWKSDRWDKLSVTTQNGYRKAYERAVDHFGDKFAEDIASPEIKRYLQYFIDKSYALKTIQTQKNIISVIYNHAVGEGFITRNPANGITLEKGLKKTHRLPPSDEDIKKIAHGDYEWLLPRILIYTGMRRGEVLALEWSDFDRKAKNISINKVVVFKSNKPTVEHRTKTAAGTRTIPLPDALARYLPRKRSGKLFDYNQSALRKKWDKWARNLGVKCTMHQLRHAYASILLDAGVEAKDAQGVLGHSDVAVTQNIYTHILQSREQKTAQKINDYFNDSL